MTCFARGISRRVLDFRPEKVSSQKKRQLGEHVLGTGDAERVRVGCTEVQSGVREHGMGPCGRTPSWGQKISPRFPCYETPTNGV